jgi:hypothetical protein
MAVVTAMVVSMASMACIMAITAYFTVIIAGIATAGLGPGATKHHWQAYNIK